MKKIWFLNKTAMSPCGENSNLRLYHFKFLFDWLGSSQNHWQKFTSLDVHYCSKLLKVPIKYVQLLIIHIWYGAMISKHVYNFNLFWATFLRGKGFGCYCQERKRRLTLLSSIYRGNGLLRPVMVSSTHPLLWSSSPVLTITFVCRSRYTGCIISPDQVFY